MAKSTEANETSVTKKLITKNVGLKVYIIGAGNAGNQVVVKAHAAGLNCFAVNTSVKDLSDEIVSSDIPSFIVGSEARGAGKNRAKAKELFKENGRELFGNTIFCNNVEESDIIVIVGAGGGGTGSELVPVISSLLRKKYPRKIVIPYIITPKTSDSLQALYNTMECIHESIEESSDSVFPADISYMMNTLTAYEDMPDEQAFDKIGTDVVNAIKSISGMYLNSSSSQMIDENDMKTILMEPGYMAAFIVSGINSKTLESTTLQDLIIEQMKQSSTVPIQKDGICKQMGIILNCPEDMYDPAKNGDFGKLYDYIGGRSKATFINSATISGTTCQMIVIISGLTTPDNHIGIYRDILVEEANSQKKQKQISLQADVDNFSFLRSNVNTKLSAATPEVNNEALDDFFND